MRAAPRRAEAFTSCARGMINAVAYLPSSDPQAVWTQAHMGLDKPVMTRRKRSESLIAGFRRGKCGLACLTFRYKITPCTCMGWA